MQAPGSRLPDMNITIQRDLKVAPDLDQIKHYLTVSTSIHLNGKVYRVLYYVPQNFIFNQTRKTIREVKEKPESLFSNSTFLVRLNETIKRMANYAVAYNLGADEDFVSIAVDNKEIKRSTLNQETRKIKTINEDLLKALTSEIAKPDQDEKRVALLKKLKQEVLKTIKTSRNAFAEGDAPSDSDLEDDSTSLKGKIDYVEDVYDEGFETEVRQVLPSADHDPDLDGFYVINTNPLTKEQRQLEEEFEEGIVNKEDFKLTPWQKFKDIFTNEKEKIAEKRYQARQAQKAQGVPSNLKAAAPKKPAAAKEDSESDQDVQAPAPAAAGPKKPVAPRKASVNAGSDREEEEQLPPPATPRKPAPKTPARSLPQTPAQTDVEGKAPVPPSRKASSAPKPPPMKKPAAESSSSDEDLKPAPKPAAKAPPPPPPPGSVVPKAPPSPPVKEDAPPPPPRSAERGPPPPPPPPSGLPSPEAKPAAVNNGPPPPPPPRSDDEPKLPPAAAVEPKADDVDPDSPPSGHESPDEGDEAGKNSAALSAKAPAAANVPDEAKAQEFEPEPEPGSLAAQLKAKAAGLKQSEKRVLPGKKEASLQDMVAKKAAARRKAVEGEGDEGKTEDDEKWLSDTPKESKP